MTIFFNKKNSLLPWFITTLSFLNLAFGGCAGNFKTRVSTNLAEVFPGMNVAILPVEITEGDQKEAAKLFRQGLYANLEQTKIRVMERYLVDALLEKNGLVDPQLLKKTSPIDLGEILGADAVVESTMTKMNRTYAVVHSSIELGVSVKMTDTRNGQVLWMTDHTEKDYDGVAKIPTGITAVAFAPLKFITNKVNLHHLTQRMTEKMVASLKNPETETFNMPIIATSALKEIEKVATHTHQPEERLGKAFGEISPIDITQDQAPISPTEIKKLSNQKRKARSAIRTLKQQSFTIQVGAYKKKAYAEKMVSVLSAKGYKAFLHSIQKDSRSEIHKVYVEKFKTLKNAVRYGRNLGKKEHLEQFVTRFPE